MEEVTVGQGQAGVSHFHHFVLYDVLGVPPSVAADSPAWGGGLVLEQACEADQNLSGSLGQGEVRVATASGAKM